MGWGGMFVVAAYSQIPYGICVDKVQETWELEKNSIKNNSKIKPWSNKDQIIWKKKEFSENLLKHILATT